jgi:NAD(P)H-flavin reductase
MLYAFGVGEVAISLSGDPAHPEVAVHTIRAVGAVTEALCRLEPGQTVGMRGPFGSGWPLALATGADVVVVAGGLGLAPLRPAVYHLLRHRADYGRVALLVGARTPEQLLFRDELDRWQARGDLQVLVTVDQATRDWHGRVGVVPGLLSEVELDPRHTHALVCGPEIMMRFAVRALQGRGLEDDRIHLSLERNMKCAIGLCGHCQFGPHFVCKDGPVLSYERIRDQFLRREV